MQRIPIKFACDGMILGKPVLKNNGMVLVSEGTKLTDSMIERLRNTEVTSITVKGRPLPALSGGLDLGRMQSRLSHLFRKYQQNPLMWTLRNMLEQHLNKCIAEEEQARRNEMEQNLANLASDPK